MGPITEMAVCFCGPLAPAGRSRLWALAAALEHALDTIAPADSLSLLSTLCKDSIAGHLLSQPCTCTQSQSLVQQEQSTEASRARRVPYARAVAPSDPTGGAPMGLDVEQTLWRAGTAADH